MSLDSENQNTNKQNLTNHVSFFYQVKDLQSAYKLHFRQVSFWRKNLMLLIGSGSALIGIYFLLLKGTERNQIFLIFLVLYGLGLILFHFWYHRTLGQRIYNKIAELQSAHEVHFDENRIRMSNSKVASDLEWKKYILALRTKEITLLYISPSMFHILPQRLFSNKQYKKIETIIEKNGIPILRF